MKRLTRAGVALASAGFTLFGAGIALGNLEILLLSLFPLLLVGTGLARPPTAAPTAARDLSTTSPARGEPFVMDVRVRGATGLVEVHAPLPPSVVLEEGSNVVLLLDEPDVTVPLRMRAHARGTQALGAITAETIDPAGVLAPRRVDVAPAMNVDVTPRAYPLSRLRPRGTIRATHAASDQDEARLGVDSTDFRELREYTWGDPVNAINWKATARRLSAKQGRGAISPLVNQYEKEGRRTVVILLDGGAALRVGTSLETGLDHAAEAAFAAARHYLNRGARVGAWTYGSRGAPFAPPETGSGHFGSIQRALAPAEPDPAATLPLALRTLRPHLVRARPTLVVVTRVTPTTALELAEAARRFRVLLGETKRILPMMVVDVKALDLAPAPTDAWDAARALVATDDADAATPVRQAGARVVPWRPGSDFRKTLHQGAMA